MTIPTMSMTISMTMSMTMYDHVVYVLFVNKMFNCIRCILSNGLPMIWYPKRYNTITLITFGSDFAALKIASIMNTKLRDAIKHAKKTFDWNSVSSSKNFNQRSTFRKRRKK